MAKMKRHKGLAKRVTVTATGKVMRRMSGSGHLLSHKSGRRKQRLRRERALIGPLAVAARRMLLVE